MPEEGIPIVEEVEEEGGFSPLRIAIFVIIVIVLASLIWWFVRSRKPEPPKKLAQQVSSIVSAIRNPEPATSVPEPPLRNDMPVPVYNDPIVSPRPPANPTPVAPLPLRDVPGTSRPVTDARPVPTPPRSTSTGPEDMEVGTSVPLPL